MGSIEETTMPDEIKFPATSIDVVLLTLKDGRLHVALQVRDKEPFKGKDAFVGGVIRMETDRNIDTAVERVLYEKTGLTDVYAEQLYTFGSAYRDPRGWTIAVAYIALVPLVKLEEARSDSLKFVPVEDVPDLAFDHERILDEAISRVRGKGSYSVLPARFLDEEFSFAEMKRVYEQVTGVKIDLSSFIRKVNELKLVEPTGNRKRVDGTRPSVMYRLAEGADTFDKKL